MRILQEEIILCDHKFTSYISNWLNDCLCSEIKCCMLLRRKPFHWPSWTVFIIIHMHVSACVALAVSISCRVRALGTACERRKLTCASAEFVNSWLATGSEIGLKNNQVDCHDLVDWGLCNCILAIGASIVQCGWNDQLLNIGSRGLWSVMIVKRHPYCIYTNENENILPEPVLSLFESIAALCVTELCWHMQQ